MIFTCCLLAVFSPSYMRHYYCQQFKWSAFLYPSHGPLRFITSHSRFALASAMRKTKRLRRRLINHMVRLVTWTNQITEFGWWKAKEWEIGKRLRERPTIFTFSQDLGYTNFYQYPSIKCPKNATRSVSLTFLSEVRKVGWWILSFLCSVRKMSYHKITSNALALTKAGLVDVVWLCLYKLTEVFIFI